MAPAHGRRADGTGPARARDRRRLREVAHPVRSPDRRLPGHRAPVRRRRDGRRGLAAARAVRDLVDCFRAARGRRADLLRLRGRGRESRAPRPRARCTRTAATASRSNTTSSSTTAARRPGRSWAAIRATSCCARPRGSVDGGGARRAARRRPLRARLQPRRRGRAIPRRSARLLRARAHARAAREGALQLGRLRRGLPERARARGPAVSALAARLRRPRNERVRDDRALGGVSPRRLDDACGDHDRHGRRDADPIRERGAQARGAAAHPRGRGRHQPRLHRARLGLGRRGRADARRARRRSLGDRRPEDVHERRAPRAVRLPADAHRSERGEAQGTHDVPRAARHARHRDPRRAHALRRAHERDLLQRRADSRSLPRRRGRTAAGASSATRSRSSTARAARGPSACTCETCREGAALGAHGAARRPPRPRRRARARAPRARRDARRDVLPARPPRALAQRDRPARPRRGPDEQALRHRDAAVRRERPARPDGARFARCARARGAAEGEAEFAYRLAAAQTIYAGSSEIMRSIIAQQALGLPRSRS